MTQWIRSMGLLALLVLSTFGCGASNSASSSNGGRSTNRDARGGPTAARVQGEGTEASPFLLCLGHGSPRTDYAFIANWQCSDGRTPLGRVERRGAEARIGNVGEGTDGHIVDLYEIPCSSGPVRVYVDGYHCPGEAAAEAMDMRNLSQRDLSRFAHVIRRLHGEPFSQRGHEARRELLAWVLDTQQFSVVICTAVGALLPQGDVSNYPYMTELLMSYAASVIEDGRPQADPVTTTEMALAGVVVFYEAVLAQDPSATNPLLETLRSAAHGGTLRAVAQQATSQCTDWSGFGVHFVRP